MGKVEVTWSQRAGRKKLQLTEKNSLPSHEEATNHAHPCSRGSNSTAKSQEYPRGRSLWRVGNCVGYGILSLRCCLGKLKEHMDGKLDCKPPPKIVTAEQRHKLGLTSRMVVAALAVELLFPQIFASPALPIPQIWAEILHPCRGLPKPPNQ